MRIAFVTYYYLPHVGGGTWFPYHVCRGLSSRGHSVTLFVPRVRFRISNPSGDSGSVPEIPIERLNAVLLPLWFAPLVGALILRPRVLLRLRKSDVVVAQFHPHHSVAFGAVLAAKLVRRPIAVRVEDTRRWMFGSRPHFRTRLEYWLAAPLNRANEWAARQAGAVLLPTSAEKATFVLGGDSSPIIVVTGNGVDTDAIAALPSREDLRRRLGFPIGSFVIVFVGRFSGGEYGADAVLAAFEALRARRGDALLVLVGDELPARLRARFGDLLNAGSVLLPGAVPQSRALAIVAAADVAIGPMFPTQATPLKVVEAVAAGTHVITGEGSIGPELHLPPSQIEVVPASSGELLEALVRLAERPPQPAPRNPDAIRGFSWLAITDLVETALCRLAGGSAASEASDDV